MEGCPKCGSLHVEWLNYVNLEEVMVRVGEVLERRLNAQHGEILPNKDVLFREQDLPDGTWKLRWL